MMIGLLLNSKFSTPLMVVGACTYLQPSLSCFYCVLMILSLSVNMSYVSSFYCSQLSERGAKLSFQLEVHCMYYSTCTAVLVSLPLCVCSFILFRFFGLR